MNTSHPDYRSIAAGLSFRTKAWIDNDYVDAADGETFVTVDPATGAHLADVAACTTTDVDRAVASARAAFERDPVLSVIRVKDADEAIQVANDTSYGLASSLWTDDLSTAHRLSRKLRAGTVSVNCFSEGDNSAPFGGFKQSGFGGRDKGVHSHDQYVETKTIWMAV